VYRVGQWHIGVRTNNTGVNERLRALLRDEFVPNEDAPPNLSVFVGDESGPIREMHRLYRGGVTVLHTRSMGRLLRATLAHLDGFFDPPATTLRLGARVVERDGTAVLVDAMLGPALDRIERRLEQVGYRCADVPFASLARDSLELALWPPRVHVDPEALARLDQDHPRERRELAVSCEQLPIRALVMPPHTDDSRPVSPARGLVELAALAVTPDGLVDAHDLGVLRRLQEREVVMRPGGWDDRQLFDLLRGLA
jgi:hypothetical protein